MNARMVGPKMHLAGRLAIDNNQRTTERQPSYCQVSYTYKVGTATYAVDGLTRDISRTGCGIRGTIMPPMGQKTRLALYLPNYILPISLDATVIWVAGYCFGVKFTEMRREDYLRIKKYMLTRLRA